MLPHFCLKQYLTPLIILIFTPPHQGVACGIKFNLLFLEKINCAASFDVKLMSLLLNIDLSVPLRLKNLNKPLIQAAESYYGTNSSHIPCVNENAIKNTIALKVLLTSYILRTCRESA